MNPKMAPTSLSGQLFTLAGMRAVITGGNRGLGLALAKGMAQAGAEIALVARERDQLEDAANEVQRAAAKINPEITFTPTIFPHDLSDLNQTGALFDKIVASAGPVDILVNCAGVQRRANAEEMTLSQWDEVLKVNLTAPFLLSQAFCRHYKNRQVGGHCGGRGRIINVCSIMAESARPTTCNNGAAKAGLLTLTKSLAVEWAQYHINVNAIGPGYFETEMTVPVQQDQQLNEWIESKIPQHRWGKPNELIGAAIYLASQASNYVTGQILYVDGGWLAAL